MTNTFHLPLHDHRARLRPLRPADAAAFAEGTADPRVREYAHLPEPHYTPESVTAMIRDVTDPGLERGDLAVLAIADATTDAFAGSLVLFDISAHGAEVGFWLHPAHRGAGLAVAALDLAVRLAWKSGLPVLTARTAPANAASRSVLERAGFTWTDTVPGRTPSGAEIDLHHYRLPIAMTG